MSFEPEVNPLPEQVRLLMEEMGKAVREEADKSIFDHMQRTVEFPNKRVLVRVLEVMLKSSYKEVQELAKKIAGEKGITPLDMIRAKEKE